MRRLSGASNGGGGGGGGNAAGGGSGAAAGPWEGGGNAARIRGVNAGIMDEKVLELVFRTLNWDPQSLCVVARVSRRLRAVAERVLWRELCVSRAPRMVAALTGGAPAASRRLGANDGRLEYFVCVSGHLHGSCWLARLSDSEGAGPDGSDAADASADEDDVAL
ncbi:EID1-like F-box protein 3 [Panicum miliaceum]|uniref:EID1-like F-box protein 3 n=1 Tax=Panicum miliaceum TaxID=4540 RepID=A0A3L6SUL6_PANMI|nr:EID1-like F-box protein 3 [Panicum miliaceum]